MAVFTTRDGNQLHVLLGVKSIHICYAIEGCQDCQGAVNTVEKVSVAIYLCQNIETHPLTPTHGDNASFSVALAADFYNFLWSDA